MDIKYKTDKVEIVIKDIRKGEVLSDEEIANIVKIIDLLKDEDSSISTGVSKIIKAPVKSNNSSDDRPVVRDRLPNQVDLSELELKKAVGTEPNIRCSHCGQSFIAVVSVSDCEYYLIRKEGSSFEVIVQYESTDDIDKISKPADANFMDYCNDIKKIKQKKSYKGLDLNVDNNTLLLCPVCKGKGPLSKWIEAYENPLDFGFETEYLCSVCGGEAVKSIDKDKNVVIKCENKDCGCIMNEKGEIL